MYYKKRNFQPFDPFLKKLVFDSGISVAGIVSTSFAVVISNGVTSFIAIIDNDNYIISILIRLFEMLDYFKDLIFLSLSILVTKWLLWNEFLSKLYLNRKSKASRYPYFGLDKYTNI